MTTTQKGENVYNQSQDFWDSYIKGRPSIPQSFFNTIFDYHASQNGSFTAAHEVGAGVGVHSPRLATRFKHVLISDIIESNIQIAKSRLQDQDCYSFKASSLEDTIDLEAGSVDLVFASTMMHFTDVDAAVRAVHHQLAPGGTFAAGLYGTYALHEPRAQKVWKKIVLWICNDIIEKYGLDDRAKNILQNEASGLDSVGLPDELFTPAKRYDYNFLERGTLRDMILPEKYGLGTIDRVGAEDEVVRDGWDRGWFTKQGIEGLKGIASTWPHGEGDPEILGLWEELRGVVGEGRWRGWMAAPSQTTQSYYEHNGDIIICNILGKRRVMPGFRDRFSKWKERRRDEHGERSSSSAPAQPFSSTIQPSTAVDVVDTASHTSQRVQSSSTSASDAKTVTLVNDAGPASSASDAKTALLGNNASTTPPINEAKITPLANNAGTTPLTNNAKAAPTHVSENKNSADGDLWEQAYEIVTQQEPDLMAAFAQHLTSAEGTSASPLVPQSITLIVERLTLERERKQWRLALFEKDIRVRNQIEKLAKFVLWSDGIIKQALSAQPYAALAWSGVSILLPSGDVIRQNIIPQLVQLYSRIIEYQARAVCYLSESQRSRAWQSVTGSNDWTGKLAEIRSSSEGCKIFIDPAQEKKISEHWHQQLAAMGEQTDILRGVHQLLEQESRQRERRHESRAEKEAIRALASDHAAYTAGKDRNPQRVEGTCEWFFKDERFSKWRGQDDSALLWVSAGPGCGKSVLSRTLIDEGHLTTRVTTSTVCYFFFKDGETGRMESTDALCAILHQLFSHDLTSHLISYALDAHKNFGPALPQQLDALWRILLDCARDPSSGEIVCVLDALDECNERSLKDLMVKLKDFYSLENQKPTARLKFLITSRPYDRIAYLYSKIPGLTEQLRLDGDENSDQLANDITLVIDERLDSLAGSLSPKDRGDIAHRMKSGKDRTYLWLHLIFSIIEEKRSFYTKRSNIEGLLSTLPSDVDEAYEEILNKSQHDSSVETLLQIILAASHPLSLDELNVAFTLAQDEERMESYAELQSNLWQNFSQVVQDLCGLFVHVHKSKVYLIHQTAREFLVQKKRGTKWQGGYPLERCTCDLFLGYDCYYWIPKAIEIAIYRGFVDVVQVFLDQRRVEVNSDLIELAIKLGELPMIALLFDHISVNSGISNIMLSNAAENQFDGANIMKLLLSKRGNGVHIGEDILKIAADNGEKGRDVIKVLLDECKDEIKISRHVLASIAYRDNWTVFDLLLDERGGELSITDDITAMLIARNSMKTTELLLDKRRDDIRVTEEVLNAALMHDARSMTESPQTLKLLLDERGDGVEITEEILKIAAAYFHEETMEVLLSKLNDRKQITEDVLKAATGNYNPKTLELLLGRFDGEPDFDKLLQLALTNASWDASVVEMLLDKGGDRINITEELLIAAMLAAGPKKAYRERREMIELLVKKRPEDLKITEDLITTAENGNLRDSTIEMLHQAKANQSRDADTHRGDGHGESARAK
ncbi:uncharacterized protein N0V89_000114 [Didymosphaeria variabile]|uniref:Methyltransferase type 11 domain-containing protein n=1 Tax=Didymosphaeria variabile TaxID=1932322 RepID=A0A9W8XTM7_9PLEO|nr:uncharacterized protein N0V89_000114 [Didymosphaeria variabile]KAJ4359559.1 hypothetical protein N0V89_000114 [Didymosphaeria variabile]